MKKRKNAKTKDGGCPGSFMREWKLPDWVENISHLTMMIDGEGRGFVVDHKGEWVRVR